ncbi:hypothetical protein A2U01_0033896 [Trifolium medium]|uniref:Uncharacterized protein n=1 Tax=Trifolium medium TaxID=97028 RepID=A0A392PMS5_9FABA|nr:hypothetical protein [Trifolium medium]
MNRKNVEYIREVTHEPNVLKVLGGDVASSSLVVLEHCSIVFPMPLDSPTSGIRVEVRLGAGTRADPGIGSHIDYE